MQRGGGGRDGFFGFGGPFPGFGSFVQPGSLISSFFGGTNPFDDPFFTNPFGAMMGPSLLQQSMFGPHRHLSGAVNSAGGFLQQAPEPSRTRGPIIKELSSDDEDDAEVNKEEEKKKGNPRKHPRMSKELYVEDPDEEAQDDKRPKLEQFGREYARASTSCPQPQTFMFQSSTITYGGPSRACYTSSTTRRTGGDITVEESKEADTTTGKATHRISRGIGNKGHSFTRKLNCDGNVNTMQTLHNLNGDELAGFEESWQRNARQNLPPWDPRVNMLVSGISGLLDNFCMKSWIKWMRFIGLSAFHDHGTVRSDVQDENQMLPLPAPDRSRGSNFSRMKMHTQNGSNSSRMKMHSQNGSSSGRSRRT